ncbi:MAG: GAF domain-containing protein [Kofleriaceae bacterium]|nr:GAF domain-containing protein [Kofleriaceae bacterium]
MVVAVEPDLDARKVLSLLPYAVLVVDREWRITFGNHEAHRLLGKTGDTLWELCPELESTSFGTAFRYAMSDRAELISESALPSVGWLQARARPIPEGGLLITLRQIHPDTTEALQARQALLVGDIGFALTRHGTLKETLQSCADALVRYLDAALARIYTLDAASRELVLEASSGDAVPDQLERIPIGRAKIGKIVERGAPYLTNDFANDARTGNREWAVRDRITSFAGYPLRMDGNVVGVLAVYGRHTFGHDVAGALASIADSIALGIERKSADEARRAAETELRAKAEQLELLNEIGKNLTSELEVGPLVQRVTNLATRLAHADFGAFFYNLDGTSPHFSHVAVAGSVARDALPALPIAPTQLVPSTFPTLPNASFLAVPVVARGGKPIGALVFGQEQAGAFTEGTEALIGGVAAQAAIAMDNARLFDDAHKLIGELENANAELDQFAYVASHDLKAPLRGIANLSQWIEDDLGDKMDEQGRYHMGLLRGRVRRLEGLIDGILHYSRADRNDGESVVVDVAKFASELWELLAPAESAKLVVKDLPKLQTAKIPLQQVLMNLMGNALKYNQGRELTVEVGAQPEGDHGEMWALYVKDDGVGISPEFHKRIWGLFQTLEPRDKVESTGIGLAVVRKIVEGRGGRAWIDSELGAGATFWFTWPATDTPTRTRHG